MHFSKKPSRIQDQDDFVGVPASGQVIKFDGTNFVPGVITGSQGFQGNQGTQGSQGSQGNQGNQGFQGEQGIIGVQGSQGFSFGFSESLSTLTKTIGLKTLVISNILSFRAGVRVRIVDITNNDDFLEGKVTSTNPVTNEITVDVDYVTGTGSASIWDVNITGELGYQGYQGINAPSIKYIYIALLSPVFQHHLS